MTIIIPFDATNGDSMCFNLESIILDDDVIEGNETFLIQIMMTNPTLTIGDPLQFVVNIEDKDDGTLPHVDRLGLLVNSLCVLAPQGCVFLTGD